MITTSFHKQCVNNDLLLSSRDPSWNMYRYFFLGRAQSNNLPSGLVVDAAADLVEDLGESIVVNVDLTATNQ